MLIGNWRLVAKVIKVFGREYKVSAKFTKCFKIFFELFGVDRSIPAGGTI